MRDRYKNKVIYCLFAIFVMMVLSNVAIGRIDVYGSISEYKCTGTSEANITFYNTVGNDSVFCFYSDDHGTRVMCLNGSTGNVTIYSNLTAIKNITANYFIGDGSLLTGIGAGGNPFNQDLNTTDSPTFAGLTLTGFNGFLKATAGVVSTTSIQVNDISNIYSTFLNLSGNNSNQDIDIGIYDFTTTGNITAGAFFGDGGNLTNINASNITGDLGIENISVNNISEFTPGYGIHLLDNTTVTENLTVGEQIFVPNGFTATPSYAFASAPNSGISYAVFSLAISLITQGVVRAQINNQALSMSVPIWLQDGTRDKPSFAFSGDADTGFYLNASGILEFVAGGEEVGRFYEGGNWSFVGNVSVGDNLDVSGDIKPTTNISFDLGNNTLWWDNLYARILHGDIGNCTNVTYEGKKGVNVETLSGAKTLTVGTDEVYQYLDEGGASRIITLATAGASAGDYFLIRHNGAYNDNHYLRIKQGATVFDYIYAGGFKEYVFDGTNWKAASTETGDNTLSKSNINIGYYSRAYSRGTSVGYQSDSYSYGAAVGYNTNAYNRGAVLGYYADGYNYGVGIGYTSDGYSYGVALGYQAKGYTWGIGIGHSADGANYGVAIGPSSNTNDKRYSVALSRGAQTFRTNELVYNIHDGHHNENNIMIAGWRATNKDAAPTEIFLGGLPNERFIMDRGMVTTFKIMVTAYELATDDVASYLFNGTIKRTAAGVTTMCDLTKSVSFEDDAAWDVNVTASNPLGALIITVTSDVGNAVNWVARLDGVQVTAYR